MVSIQLLTEGLSQFLKETLLTEGSLFNKIKVEPLKIEDDDTQNDTSQEVNELQFGGQNIGRTMSPEDIKKNLASIEKQGFKVSDRGKLVPIHNQKIKGKAGGAPVLDKDTGIQQTNKKGELKFTKAIKGIKNSAGTDYDLNVLRDMITARPDHLLSKNEKMQHGDAESGNEYAVQFFNIGLPALMAVVYDEEKHEFVKVLTCPGAGGCKTICYALAGNYIMVPDSQMYRTKCLNWLLNKPDEYASQLVREINNKQKDFSKYGIEVRIRWHDAGDFFADAYKDVAFKVARACPNVKFYAYTKMGGLVSDKSMPSNFLIRFSMGATEGQTNKVGEGDYNSYIVPTSLFTDLFVLAKNRKQARDPKTGLWSYKDPSTGEQQLKQRIATAYKLNPETVLSYDDYMDNRDTLKKEKIYNVIIRPGQSDFPASEHNVKAILNLQH